MNPSLREPARLILCTLESASSVRDSLLAGSDWARCADLLDSYRLLLSPTSSLAEAEDDLRLRLWHHRLGNNEAAQREVLDCEAKLRSQAARRVLSSEESSPQQKYFSQMFLEEYSGEGVRRPGDRRPGDRRTSGGSSWQCRLCGEGLDVGGSDVSVVRCQSGHCWPRCVSTQQPVAAVSPWRCAWCRSLSLLPGRCSLCRGRLYTVGQKIS